MPITVINGKKLSTVELNWKEVFYTNCGMVSASNVDQELTWCRTDFAAIGVDYAHLLSRRENDWYPHYIHNLDNLVRFGGLYPTIHVQADIRRTRLLGATPTYEGGCMLVRAKDRIYKMSHLKGKRIGLSKSLNTLKADWWRITEHYGILNMLMLNDMSIEDVEIVEFPDADDWYTDPKMCGPVNSATEFYMGKVDHKRTLITRPLETALLEGKVDAIYTHSKTWQHLQEDTGKIAAIEDLSRYPDWRLQANNEPAVITCSDVMAEQHPELVVTFLKAMIKVGRWANEHKHAAAVILDRQTYYRDVEDTYQYIKLIDMVPSLSPKNLAQIEIGKDFMLEHGYIKRDFDVHEWAAPEFLEKAGKELIEERWEKATSASFPKRPWSGSDESRKRSGSERHACWRRERPQRNEAYIHLGESPEDNRELRDCAPGHRPIDIPAENVQGAPRKGDAWRHRDQRLPLLRLGTCSLGGLARCLTGRRQPDTQQPARLIEGE